MRFSSRRFAPSGFCAVMALGWMTDPCDSAKPGDALRSGMQLVYSRGSAASPPWVIDSVQHDATIGGRRGCARIHLRTAPESPAEVRAICVWDGEQHAWNAATSSFVLQRPVAANKVVVLPGRGGASSKYETGACETERVGAHEIVVFPTVVTTMDSTGKIVRRLRERYAPSLGTATGGIFEVPDPSAPGGWKTQLEFRLVEIR
jgi:hypothetical protein